ncbi:MAG: TolC family protein [Candidatus Gastranaerophilaceae bacterium]
MNKKIYTFIIFFVLLNNFSYAQEVQTPLQPTVLPIQKSVDSQDALKANTSKEISTYEKISLPDSVSYALSHNLDIKGNRLNVDIARNSVKAANRLRNPSILSFLNVGKAATDNPNSIGMIFPIDIAKRGVRKNLAKSKLELTKGDVALAELNLRLDVRQAYVDLVAAKSTLKILNGQRQLVSELLDIAQKKYDAGAVPQMDVIHAKMTLNQLLIQVNSANTEVYVARYNFNRLLNSQNYDSLEDYLPEQKEFISLLTPKPVEKMPDFNELLNIAIQTRLDLKNAQKDIDVAQKNLTVTIRQRVPDIELGGGYMFVPQQMATSNSLAQGAYVAGNITNIPLLYQYSPEIKNAKIQVDQKQLAYNSLKNQAMMNLHSAYDEFNTAQDNLNYYDDVLLSESGQFLNMAKRSYEVGKSNITDFVFIQQSYKAIMMGYTMALANYYNSWINVLREVNDEELKLHG